MADCDQFDFGGNFDDDDDESDNMRAEPVKGCGFNREEYEICLKVISKIMVDPDALDRKEYKNFKKSIMPIIEKFQGRFFFGGTMDAVDLRRERQRQRNAQLQREKNNDRNKIEKTTLRNHRLQKLSMLMDEMDSPEVLLIPDGPAACDTNNNNNNNAAAMMLENSNDEQQPIQQQPIPISITEKLLHGNRSCYRCKCRFSDVHFFYSELCPPCADLNFKKRSQSCDLQGRIALVTGGRVKIGYQTSLKLLRAGGLVIVTSRFPHDCALRYSQEPDFDKWKENLHVYGLDLRDLAAIEMFVIWIRDQYHYLDILVNNACQTVRRPPTYYKHLIEAEQKGFNALPANVQKLVERNPVATTRCVLPSIVASEEGNVSHLSTTTTMGVGSRSAELSQLAIVPGDEHEDRESFPLNSFDVNNQQVDMRKKHSWTMTLEEISTPELVEVFSINSIAPFILNGKLKPLMKASPNSDRYIINVSAMEGKFYRFKTDHHPHTNMAKAALNMMTRTSAREFSEDGIYMNSVDTGWINDEKPVDLAAQHTMKTQWQTPIDEVDAAARILDPVFLGINDHDYQFGKFFKDYRETEW